MSGRLGVPTGMREVTREEFFALLKADRRDIMPHHDHRDYTTWEVNRLLWGWSLPGWGSPSGTPAVYAVLAREALVAQPCGEDV